VPDIQVTVQPAGEEAARVVTRTVEPGTRAWQLFADDQAVIAARVGEALKDLAYELEDGDVVEPVAIDSADGRAILRHSTAHVMAQAVQELWPEARLGIGPPITDGFYYDFDVAEPFVPADLEKIETRMRKIVKEGQRFSRRPVSDGEALSELADEPYKVELIGLKGGTGEAAEAAEGAGVEVGAGELTIYDNLRRDGSLAWKDLCRGPHLPTTKRIPAFKLMRTAAAYWRGTRRTSSSSASTAPRGSPGTRSRRTCTGSRRPSAATTASSAASSTCSASPTRSGPAWPSSTPRAG
jgi:threonyl-tRNA synthetase